MIADDAQMRAASLLKRWSESAKLCTEDLRTLSNLSSSWDGMDREQIATDAARGLVRMLELEFAAVQFTCEVEIFRHSASHGETSELSAVLLQALQNLPQETYTEPTIFDWQSPSGRPVMRIVRIPVGLRDDGWVFAGSTDENFPTDSEFVVLTACANLTAIALQNWRTGHDRRVSDEHLRQLSENSPNLFSIVKVDGMQIEYLSPAFNVIWDNATETMLGDIGHWLDTIHADDQIAMLAAFASVIHGEVMVQQYRIVRPELVIRRIRHVLFPIRDGQGRVVRVGGVAEDITKRADLQVYVLSNDASSRERFTVLLRTNGYDVKAFTSSRVFLEAAPVLVPGCLILECRGTDARPLRIVSELKARRIDLPIIVVDNSRGDVGAAVKAMKAGAMDCLEAPYKRAELLAAVASALAGVQNLQDTYQASKLARVQVANMTPRERAVLLGLVAGETNKEIARRLGISPRTVETHRAHVMERLGVKTLSEAVLLAASADRL